MDRESLEKMKLEALRLLALEQGVAGAGQMGRAQLIEKLATPAPAEPTAAEPPTAEEPAAAAPSLIERAKEKVAEVAHEVAQAVAEKLHKPAAAPREPRRSGVPARGSFDVPSSTVHPHAEELETLTMARLYVAERHWGRALEIFEKLALVDPEDAEVAKELAAVREKIGEAKAQQPAPAPPPPSDEPFGMLDLEELPDTYGFDECEVLYKDPHWVFVYWEVTESGLQGARAQLGSSEGAGSARLVLRLFSTVAGASGMDRQIQDLDLDWNHGRRYVQSPRPGVHLRAAVGLLSPEGYFAPIAHSSLVRLPPPAPDTSDTPVEWMEVLPGRMRGREREQMVIVRRGHPHAERGVATLSGGGGGAGPGGASPTRPPGGGSSGGMK
jgi:hypothetical protein